MASFPEDPGTEKGLKATARVASMATAGDGVTGIGSVPGFGVRVRPYAAVLTERRQTSTA
jgi:hypothetical protein